MELCAGYWWLIAIVQGMMLGNGGDQFLDILVRTVFKYFGLKEMSARAGPCAAYDPLV